MLILRPPDSKRELPAAENFDLGFVLRYQKRIHMEFVYRFAQFRRYMLRIALFENRTFRVKNTKLYLFGTFGMVWGPLWDDVGTIFRSF